MGQSDNELRCNYALLGSLEVGSYRLADVISQRYSTRTRSLTAALEQEKQFHSVRHTQFLEDMKQIILDGVLAEPESICNLLVAFAVRCVFGHLSFPTGKLVNLAGFDAFVGWSASEGFEQEL